MIAKSSRVRARAFRLIPYGVYDAVTNMAVDEALLDLHLGGNTPPTLRFYGWSPPAVSFGYAQKVSAETVARIKNAGYDVVRRPTGGRAVLHEGELTYCFIASSRAELMDFSPELKSTSADADMRGAAGNSGRLLNPGSEQEALPPAVDSPYEPVLDSSVARAYRQICDALISGLTMLGVETTLGKGEGGSYKNYEDCFNATTQADLQFQGKKIVGSAQLRRRNGVMQHGSIMLNQPQERMAELLGIKSGTTGAETDLEEEGSQKRHFNLCDILKSEVDRTAIEEAIGRGFTKTFDCRFAVYDIKDEEWELVQKLKADPERYRINSDA